MPGMDENESKEVEEETSFEGKDSLPVMGFTLVFISLPFPFNHIIADEFHYCCFTILTFFSHSPARISINHEQLKNAFELILIKFFGVELFLLLSTVFFSPFPCPF